MNQILNKENLYRSIRQFTFVFAFGSDIVRTFYLYNAKCFLEATQRACKLIWRREGGGEGGALPKEVRGRLNMSRGGESWVSLSLSCAHNLSPQLDPGYILDEVCVAKGVCVCVYSCCLHVLALRPAYARTYSYATSVHRN